MPKYHIAQINIGRILAPIDDPIMADFVSQLPPVNALADASPGFVWRLQTESGDATSIRVYEDEMVAINMSVWESVDTLREYVYKSAHSGVLRDRKRWFEKFDGPYYALWWIPAGHIPSTEEGKERLDYLRRNIGRRGNPISRRSHTCSSTSAHIRNGSQRLEMSSICNALGCCGKTYAFSIAYGVRSSCVIASTRPAPRCNIPSAKNGPMPGKSFNFVSASLISSDRK